MVRAGHRHASRADTYHHGITPLREQIGDGRGQYRGTDSVFRVEFVDPESPADPLPDIEPEGNC